MSTHPNIVHYTAKHNNAKLIHFALQSEFHTPRGLVEMILAATPHGAFGDHIWYLPCGIGFRIGNRRRPFMVNMKHAMLMIDHGAIFDDVATRASISIDQYAIDRLSAYYDTHVTMVAHRQSALTTFYHCLRRRFIPRDLARYIVRSPTLRGRLNYKEWNANMGCCASVGVPVWAHASESAVWRHLVLISSEASYRLSLGLEASEAQTHGVQAWDAVKTLHTRFAWSWVRIEAELRRRDMLIWLYRRAISQGEEVEVEDWGEEVMEGNGEVAVLIGTQLEAITMRSLMRERGVNQSW